MQTATKTTRYLAYDCPNPDASAPAYGCPGGIEIEVTRTPCDVSRRRFLESTAPTHCTKGCALTDAQIDHYTRCAEGAAED